MPQPQFFARRSFRVTALALAAAISVGGCAGVVAIVKAEEPDGGPGSGSGQSTGSGGAAEITLALGGDSNVEGEAGRLLTEGLGGVGKILARADVAIVNSETIVTDDRSGLQPEAKQFTFLAPTRFLGVLGKNGVDAVSLANNHGMDFGRKGLERTSAARTQSLPFVVGAGENLSEAFAPWRTTVKGRGVLLFGATDVLDKGVDWAATPDRSGIASIKTDEGYALLRQKVREARQASATDVIIVYLHTGVERRVCPTGRQQMVAHDLASDGATVVAMSHAHVLQPYTEIGDTAVAYGLGNFIFEAHSPGTGKTGVLSLTIPASGPSVAAWHPATIRSGLPVLDRGSAAERSLASWKNLGNGC